MTKPEKPKINLVEINYSGDTKMFEDFLSAVIVDYLNSDTIPDGYYSEFSGNVEIYADEK